jgi:hypothetical protein
MVVTVGSTASQVRARPIHRPLAITAAIAEDDSTRGAPLVVNGVARQTYHAERQTKA